MGFGAGVCFGIVFVGCGQLQAKVLGQGTHSSETSRAHRMNRPSAIFMMLALCTAVTRFRPLSWAYLNAYSATRLLATRVMICG